MSTHTEHYHFLDLVRTIGILQVVLFHVVFGVFSYGGSNAALALIEQLPTWMTFAWQPFGVDAIFLVSSFLLTSTLLDEHARFGRIDVRSFVLKRLSRILPLYYLALLLFQLGSPFDPLQFALSAVFLGVTLGVGNVIPVGWSMEVMMLFFLLMPILLTLILKCTRPLLILGLAILITTGSRVAYLHISEISAGRVFLDTYQSLPASDAAKHLYYHPWFRLPPFLVGMGLAIAFYRASSSAVKHSWRGLGFAGLFVIIICCYTPVHIEDAWLYRLPEPVLVVYFGSSITTFSFGLSMVIWNSLVFGAKWTRPLGQACKTISQCIFGIYLFHMPFLALAAVMVIRSTDKAQLATISAAQTWMIFTLTAIFSIIFAQLLLRYIEIPTMKLLRRLSDRPWLV
ncbi:MAG: acyltransferase [Bacteroidetes bacterium]|nr:acyltransferase [Bacteroidota bacterium]